MAELDLNSLSLNLYAKNSEELKFHLKSCNPGDVIKLAEGTFVGPFHVSCHGVTLKGASKDKSILTVNLDLNSSKIKGIFESSYNDTTISDLTILIPHEFPASLKNGAIINGEKASIKNLKIDGGENLNVGAGGDQIEFDDERSCINIKGNYGTFANLELENAGTGLCFQEYAKDHIVNDISLKNLGYGLFLDRMTSDISITRVSCQDVEVGVMFLGKNSLLDDMLYEKTRPHAGRSSAVVIYESCDNVVENVTCDWDNYLGERGTGLEIGYTYFETGNRVKNCFFGKVRLFGSPCSLENVDCGILLEIEESGQELTEVHADTLEIKRSEQSAVFNRCNFTVTISKDEEEELNYHDIGGE